ncbi:hypothetical protein PR202_gb20884 [Eleusine coracana subsp. coracana]|uniref:Uncharacterized protein n=1 Tax=Eleusine coracana subsp. coracana TaxID=191504 RepID=A0AAV5FCJ4_ELECO|nr:hypothetical protein PR202_gb20884 [Eleusine coracana subsp. coracana]
MAARPTKLARFGPTMAQRTSGERAHDGERNTGGADQSSSPNVDNDERRRQRDSQRGQELEAVDGDVNFLNRELHRGAGFSSSNVVVMAGGGCRQRGHGRGTMAEGKSCNSSASTVKTEGERFKEMCMRVVNSGKQERADKALRRHQILRQCRRWSAVRSFRYSKIIHSSHKHCRNDLHQQLEEFSAHVFVAGFVRRCGVLAGRLRESSGRNGDLSLALREERARERVLRARGGKSGWAWRFWRRF